MPKSDIPMGSEFGPNQVNLVTVLELAEVGPSSQENLTSFIVQRNLRMSI